ncbi:AbiH family protein [Acidovorax sp.]|uniref:AbiH family protein n=1 Tax=Acidovorax sp. TaxID=1872122 RepID=UPI003D03DFD9
MTFNYTDTLQRVYGIQHANVVHIHGSASQANDELVLGHGWHRTPTDSFNHGINFEEADTREIEGNEIIDEYFSSTFKPTARIIEENQAFFQSLENVSMVLVMGHSLSSVDLPYLREIRSHLRNERVRWRVSFHGDSRDAQEGMRNIEIPTENVRFFSLSEPSRWTVP